MRVQGEQTTGLFDHACRLLSVADAPRDYFERARAWAATGLFVSAGLLIIGSFLDWVMIEELPGTIPPDQVPRARPFNGFDIRDGYWTAIAGGILLVCAVMILLRARSARVAFVVAIVAGGIAISDYRGIAEVFDEFGGIGAGIEPGLGLTLVTVGAFLALLSSVAAIVATPKR